MDNTFHRLMIDIANVTIKSDLESHAQSTLSLVKKGFSPRNPYIILLTLYC